MTSELESAMATRPNSSDQRLRFLDLPFEIRTMIYTELFVVRKELFAVKKKKILGNFDDDDDEGTSQTL